MQGKWYKHAFDWILASPFLLFPEILLSKKIVQILLPQVCLLGEHEPRQHLSGYVGRKLFKWVSVWESDLGPWKLVYCELDTSRHYGQWSPSRYWLKTQRNEQKQTVWRFWSPGEQRQSDLFTAVTPISKKVHGTKLVLTRKILGWMKYLIGALGLDRKGNQVVRSNEPP